MLGVSNFITRHAINWLVGFSVFILTVINFDLGIILVPLLSIASYFTSNKGIASFQKYQRSKQLGISRSEYNHIEKQLKQAKEQIFKLNQQYIRVRSLKSFKLINDMSKLSRRIVNIVQTSPRKFFVVEDFFYAHLPSAVELTDKYTLLTKEQVQGTDIHIALEDTRKTLKELHITMEDDLKLALQSDIEDLKLELDFAKLENEKRKERQQIGGGH
ncbi:5-bromo-4-chloroindolyl phosphate hydrolysis family protein [Lysinibacillus sp. 54212]|uniref:5-bromo-4-chloroindolyl phosphate hydrolysis family protein n=1 Tax=Lysinibacillus sp. 54212 TaxID=3119829 RepID=UPI002FCB0EAD